MKVAILGAGIIVPDFLKAAVLIDDIELYAIMGQPSDREKMEEFSKEYGIQKLYFNYDDVLNDDNVEVVYVALPNHLHYWFAMQALKAKKNVIVEKPFVPTVVEAMKLFNTAEENGVHVFEAVTNQYLPSYHKTKEIIPQLGDLKIAELNFSQYSRRYDKFKAGEILPVFDVTKCGGALMDLNVYNVHFMVGLFGKPKDIHYFANIERGIDTSGMLVLEYPTFKCVSIAAKDCKAPVCINLEGDKGYMHSDICASLYKKFIVGQNSGEVTEYDYEDNKPILYHELLAFVEAMKQPKLFKDYNQHSLEVVEVLQKARMDAGIKFKGE